MNESDLIEFIFKEVLPGAVSRIPERTPDSGFALPASTLACFREIIDRLKITALFEFGSGRSTQVFLERGCRVTSLEDSDRWMQETAGYVEAARRQFWSPHVAPLTTVFDGFTPMRSWRPVEELVAALRRAQLILIDSPSYPPFREHALITSLRHSKRGLIVVDDANIPTVGRFCDRIAMRNPKAIRQYRTGKDHGLSFLMKLPGGARLDLHRGVLETGKGWRRFIAATRPV
jgi:hypothetical protein